MQIPNPSKEIKQGEVCLRPCSFASEILAGKSNGKNSPTYVTSHNYGRYL